ncbi:hypothetical protein FACS1894106_3710 [Spirochaetia bacterium]|nr:hypothetical protein FACS1894106_3710 [Spirochaetia bacterium]
MVESEQNIFEAVNNTLAEIRNRTSHDDIKLKRTTIGQADQWVVSNEKAAAGIDISGFTHEITNHFIIHTIKKHGNPQVEQPRGNVAITNDDFLRIPQMIESPDITCFGLKRRSKGKTQDAILYAKDFDDGASLLFEVILTGKANKALRGVTFFKKKNRLTKEKVFNILNEDKQNDISNLKIVVGAGGQTGDEAT